MLAEPVSSSQMLETSEEESLDETGIDDEPDANLKAEKEPSATTANPCQTSHKGVFYDNDFTYLLEPDYDGCCFGDCWKLMPAECSTDRGTLDVGGQLRLRYHHEVGMGQDLSGPGVQRFEDTVHDIFLTRLRLYANWKANERTRVFIEGIYADVSDDEDTYRPRPIDRNFGDFLN
ncbi:MAG TPA: hypothetical protein VGK58_22510, partial [Lacipirellulaceae bacterium]